MSDIVIKCHVFSLWPGLSCAVMLCIFDQWLWCPNSTAWLQIDKHFDIEQNCLESYQPNSFKKYCVVSFPNVSFPTMFPTVSRMYFYSRWFISLQRNPSGKYRCNTIHLFWFILLIVIGFSIQSHSQKPSWQNPIYIRILYTEIKKG